jgi:hypothetical protein
MLPIILAVGIGLSVTGCSLLKGDTVYIEPTNINVYHPETPLNPRDPGVRPTIITVERLEKEEIPDVAYVGFKYNEWLEFAKWMHEYRSVQLELREIIKGYEDILSGDTNVDDTGDNDNSAE